MSDIYINLMQSMIGVAAGLFIGAPNVHKNDKFWGVVMLIITFALGFIHGN